jgi:predicted porin
MKKLTIITAFAALAALSGLASAQSNVTVFGVIDMSVNSVTNGSTHTTTVDSSQQSTSRIGVMGTEKISNDTSASFFLDSALDTTMGTAGAGTTATASSQFFNRRATLSLTNTKLGELRLGRDYTPTYNVFQRFDVFTANGLAEGWTYSGDTLKSGASTNQRANNAISYFTPDTLGGFYGQVMYAPDEGVAGAGYTGARVGYVFGKAEVQAARGVTKTSGSLPDFTVTNVGASYDFGMIKVFGLWNQNKYDPATLTSYELSAAVPVFGTDEVRFDYGHGKYENYNANASVNQFGAQYLHNLSKRTALYAGFSRIDNDGKSNFMVIKGGTSSAADNFVSSGYNVGVRHIF